MQDKTLTTGNNFTEPQSLPQSKTLEEILYQTCTEKQHINLMNTLVARLT